MEKIDLHIHTNNSDGSLSPKEIIDLAKNNNIEYISITDHDNINSYTEELIKYAQENNIVLINGIELSTKHTKCGIHILGYNIDINNNFKKELNKIKKYRHNYLKEVSEKLTQAGYKVNYNKLNKISSVTKAHIAKDIINNKENINILLKKFNHIPNMGEFIETIMNENCECYVEKKSLSPLEAANLIRKYHGKVVIAHPVAYTYEDNLSENDIQELVDNIHPDGIEAYYLYNDKYNNIHNDINKWLNFTNKNNLFTTIGSDYHNDNNPIKLGFININTSFNINPEEIINNILN